MYSNSSEASDPRTDMTLSSATPMSACTPCTQLGARNWMAIREDKTNLSDRTVFTALREDANSSIAPFSGFDWLELPQSIFLCKGRPGFGGRQAAGVDLAARCLIRRNFTPTPPTCFPLVVRGVEKTGTPATQLLQSYGSAVGSYLCSYMTYPICNELAILPKTKVPIHQF